MKTIYSRLTLSAIVFSLLLSVASTSKADEFVEIFNKKDLTGWVAEGRKDYKKDGEKIPIWTVKDGEMHCDGHGYGFLRYDKKLCDYILTLEYNMNKNCNSGIGIRGVKYIGKGHTAPSRAGFELQILDDANKKPTNHSSMSLYRYMAAKVNAVKPAGQWNKIQIEIRGPITKVTLNGKLLHNVDQSKHENIKNKPLCGYICVQNHNHYIRFRNIRIKEIKQVEEKEK